MNKLVGKTMEGKKIEVRECATLGTNFADVYIDGKLFARELSRPVALTFARHSHFYGNAFVDEAKLRTWVIESWDAWVVENLERDKAEAKKKKKKSTVKG